MILKNSENNGTEEIALVTPTPGWQEIFVAYEIIHLIAMWHSMLNELINRDGIANIKHESVQSLINVL